jgi:hypothetical protein
MSESPLYDQLSSLRNLLLPGIRTFARSGIDVEFIVTKNGDLFVQAEGNGRRIECKIDGSDHFRSLWDEIVRGLA